MNKTEEAVKYMIDVWDEVTGKTWRQSPDHVQQKFLSAEKELLNLACVTKSEAALFAEIKAMTEHLTQEERNEYFDFRISKANNVL